MLDQEIEFQVRDLYLVFNPLQHRPLVDCARRTHTQTHRVVVDHTIYRIWVVDIRPRVSFAPAGAYVINMVAVTVCLKVLGVGQVLVGQRTAFCLYAASQPRAYSSRAFGGHTIFKHGAVIKSHKAVEGVGNPSHGVAVQRYGETAPSVAFPAQGHRVMCGCGRQI